MSLELHYPFTPQYAPPRRWYVGMHVEPNVGMTNYEVFQ